MESFQSVASLLSAEQPAEPVYCVYPHVYQGNAEYLVNRFPGRVLYAVKANAEPAVLECLHAGGVRHFDCASLEEVRLVNEHCPGSTCYFMVPVRIRGAASSAFHDFGVRHFMVDHADGIDLLAAEIDLSQVVVFVRMAVSHEAAALDLSWKFGAPPADVPALVSEVRSRGAEAAVAFNVGSLVTDPAAYAYALEIARKTLQEVQPPVRLLDIGGGYPKNYPGFKVPELEEYISTIESGAQGLNLAENAELLTEPGRALAAPGLSAIIEVLLRKDRRLYINDGLYGIFWELRFKIHKRYAARAYRNGKILAGPTEDFRIFGPTCDASDELPARVPLPADIRSGDHVEFGSLGAYSLSGRTDFNGLHSERLVRITDPLERPPA